MSLAEIGEELGVSRNAVHKVIQGVEEKLNFYEEKLGLAKRFRTAQKNAEQLLLLLDGAHIDGEIRTAAEELAESVR